jgi:hypothetical protein
VRNGAIGAVGVPIGLIVCTRTHFVN